jgi:hypothetical protein
MIKKEPNESANEEEQPTEPRDEDTFRILVVTDTHLGKCFGHKLFFPSVM